MKKLQIIFMSLALALTGCDFLDVVPDNVATLEQAFNMRLTAEQYLYTCYSYMPSHGNLRNNLARTAGDEIWLPERVESRPAAWEIARGNQRVNDPYMNYWQGNQGAKDLYEGIRQCNIFIESIDRVPDMMPAEKDRWKGEAIFLKAYYHFYLLRMYGPIPLIKENVPVTADKGEVYPTRNTIDDCFDYVVELLDEAIGLLPLSVSENSEYGRATQAVAYCQKAIVLTEAASPLFNGNPDYQGFKNTRGEELFDKVERVEKWQKAAEACKAAIEFCKMTGYKLYTWENNSPVGTSELKTKEMKTQISIRAALTEPELLANSEVVWGNTNSYCGNLQQDCAPRGLNGSGAQYFSLVAPTLKIAEMFYSENGVPIDEDKDYDYAGRWNLVKADATTQTYIRNGETTVGLHFHREPRFYASLGFDRGVWFGHTGGNLKDDNLGNLLYIKARNGEENSAKNEIRYSVTGYWAKKLIHYNTGFNGSDIMASGNMYRYAWPEIRLANLYLLYAEALNEANGGPTEEAYLYIDTVRGRAGLEGVEKSWLEHSTRQDYNTYTGFKRIVHRERLIELVFEGNRFWDLRRWKQDALDEWNKPVMGWDIKQMDMEGYYRQKTLFFQRFTTRDFFWPIPEAELLSNKNLKQMPGW